MLATLLELTKFRIASLSTLSAATGYIAFARALRWNLVPVALGVLLLAMGASALNEWQDLELDGKMERTRRRPLPSGRLRPAPALWVSAVLLLVGSGLLLAEGGPVPLALGLLAAAWYNGVYTYLKRVSAFAVVPGSLIGSLPPAIGWSAAGGGATDPQVLALCFFFFVWQVPHFWLLLLVYGRDYQQAGLPTPTSIFSREQLARLTFLWVLATAGSSLLLRVYGVVSSPYVALGLVAAGGWLVWTASRPLRREADRASFGRAFGGINLYALVVMALLVADALGGYLC